MTLSAAEQALAEQILTARHNRRPVASRGNGWGVDEAGAYRIQVSNMRDDQVIGFKLGLLSPAAQRQMGIDEPIHGHIVPAMLREEAFALSTFLQPRIEPEIAVMLAKGIPIGSSPGAVARAVGGFFLGLDVLDTVWSEYRFTLAEVVADNTSGGAFVLGNRMMQAPPAGELTLLIDGKPVTSRSVHDLGDPYQRLATLADNVGGLEAGQVVFLGSPAQAVPATAGVLEVHAGVDSFSVRVVEA